MENDSENPDASKGVEPGLLFLLPFLGYALAFVYETGAFVWVDAPISHIAISVPHIVIGCLVLVVPLFNAALATSANARKFLARGWMGFFHSILSTALPYVPIAVIGVWTDNILAVFLVIASTLLYTAVTMGYFVQESPIFKKYVWDFPPLVRRFLAFSLFGLLTLGLGLAAGMVGEQTTRQINVVDAPCGAYNRVFRTNGDSMLILPAYRGPEHAFELWSLSNRGAVRIKLVSQEEYAHRRGMAGPCLR